MVDLGHCLLGQDKVTKAKEVFNEALALDMNSQDALQGRGQCSSLLW